MPQDIFEGQWLLKSHESFKVTAHRLRANLRHPPVVSTQQAKIDNFFGASSTKAKQLWYWIRKVVLIPEPFTGTWKEERRRELPKKQQRLPLVQQMMTPTMTHRWLRAERPAES